MKRILFPIFALVASTAFGIDVPGAKNLTGGKSCLYSGTTASVCANSTGVVLPSTNAGTGTGVASSTTTLDFFESMTFTSTFTPNGTGSTGASQSLQVTRVGKAVTLQFGSMGSMTCAGSSTAIVSATALPSRFWPNGAVIVPIGAYVNGGSNTNGGQIQVTGAGVINVNRDVAGTAFTNGGCGTIQSTITYATP